MSYRARIVYFLGIILLPIGSAVAQIPAPQSGFPRVKTQKYLENLKKDYQGDIQHKTGLNNLNSKRVIRDMEGRKGYASARGAEVKNGDQYEHKWHMGPNIIETLLNHLNDLKVSILSDLFNCWDFALKGLCITIDFPSIDIEILKEYRWPVQMYESSSIQGVTAVIPDFLQELYVGLADDLDKELGTFNAYSTYEYVKTAIDIEMTVRGKDIEMAKIDESDIPEDIVDKVYDIDLDKRVIKPGPDTGMTHLEWHMFPNLTRPLFKDIITLNYRSFIDRFTNMFGITGISASQSIPPNIVDVIQVIWQYVTQPCHKDKDPTVLFSDHPYMNIFAKNPWMSAKYFPKQFASSIVNPLGCLAYDLRHGEPPSDMYYPAAFPDGSEPGCMKGTQGRKAPMLTDRGHGGGYTAGTEFNAMRGFIFGRKLKPNRFYDYDEELDRIQYTYGTKDPSRKQGGQEEFKCHQTGNFMGLFQESNFREEDDFVPRGFHWRYFKCCKGGKGDFIIGDGSNYREE